MPGTNRIASGTFIAPELRISLLVTTATAAAACERGWGLRVTEVTTTLVSCSMLSCFSSLTWLAAASRGCARSTGEAATSAPASQAARTLASGQRLRPQVEEESGICSPPFDSGFAPPSTVPRPCEALRGYYRKAASSLATL